MHQALQIVEIRQMIVESMANEPELERNPALYALATTCTDFRDPALDLLWRKQKGLGNLIKCMPADLWQLHKCYVWNNASPYHRAEYDRLVSKAFTWGLMRSYSMR